MKSDRIGLTGRRLRQGAWAAGVAAAILLATATTLRAQGDDIDPSAMAELAAGYGRPIAIPSPAHNPTTPEKVELGKALFFDPRLSGSGAISCATCHNPALGWEDAQARSMGEAGAKLARHTQTILNAAWIEPLFWDGRAASLEEQAKAPLTAPTEMNMTPRKVAAVVRRDPGYVASFSRAFPGEEIDIDAVAKAIAAYERTVVSAEAPFDRWIAGDEGAIPSSAKRGFVVFNTKAKCAACHSSWRFTDDGFRDIGLPGDDPGRGKIAPGVPALAQAFKTPTLRNVAERAPYMHDGSLDTLEQVIDHYDDGFVRRPSLAAEMTPLNLSGQDKRDLVAFLRTLSSPEAGLHPTQVASRMK